MQRRKRKTNVLTQGLTPGYHEVVLMRETFNGTAATFYGVDVAGTLRSIRGPYDRTQLSSL